MSGKAVTLTAVIANGQSLSAAALTDGAELVGMVMPAAWTTANITFQASADGSTYNDLYDQYGTEINVPAGASRYIALNPGDFAGIKSVKVRSGTTGAPVAQGAERTVQLVAEEL